MKKNFKSLANYILITATISIITTSLLLMLIFTNWYGKYYHIDKPIVNSDGTTTYYELVNENGYDVIYSYTR